LSSVTRVCDSCDEYLADLLERRVAKNADLVALILLQLRDFILFDALRSLVLLTPFRENTRALMTVPSTPGGTRSDVSRTSPAFSPKIAP